MGTTLTSLAAHDRASKSLQTFPSCCRWLLVNSIPHPAFVGFRVEIGSESFELVELSDHHAILRTDNRHLLLQQFRNSQEVGEYEHEHKHDPEHAQHPKGKLGICREIHLQSGVVFTHSKALTTLVLLCTNFREDIQENEFGFVPQCGDALNSRVFRPIDKMATDPQRDLFAVSYIDDVETIEIHNSSGLIATVDEYANHFALGAGCLATLSTLSHTLTVWRRTEDSFFVNSDFYRSMSIHVAYPLLEGLACNRNFFSASEFGIHICAANTGIKAWNWLLQPQDCEKPQTQLLWHEDAQDVYDCGIAKDHKGLVLRNIKTEEILELRQDTDNRPVTDVTACFKMDNRLVALSRPQPNRSEIVFMT
jgi:hypothetical protein